MPLNNKSISLHIPYTIQALLLGAHRLLEEGKLVEILGEYNAPAMSVSLLYPHRRNLSKRVRVLMDWLSELVKAETQRND